MLLPSVIVGGIVGVVLRSALHYGALLVASALATGLIAVELLLAIRWLGAVFDRFDVTAP